MGALGIPFLMLSYLPDIVSLTTQSSMGSFLSCVAFDFASVELETSTPLLLIYGFKGVRS